MIPNQPFFGIQFEKLLFLLEEIHIAEALAKCAPDSQGARVLARHVAVRAENFIIHVRRLRNELQSAGYSLDRPPPSGPRGLLVH